MSVVSVPGAVLEFELSIQNHAEFVSIRTVDALSHNSHVAVGKLDKDHSLVEILGIKTVGPMGAIREEPGSQDKVRSN